MTSHVPDDEEARLAWEFTLLGQNPFNWVLSGASLLAAADLAYGRFIAAARLQAGLYHRDTAGRLVAVSRVLSQAEVDLLPDLQLGPVALMLLGFGIENWAKGLMVQVDPTLVAPGGLAVALKNHRLGGLVRACNEELDGEEERALTLLSQYTMWAGRYPIPVRPFAPRPQPDPSTLSPQVDAEWLWDNAGRVVTRLRQRVKAEFPNAAV